MENIPPEPKVVTGRVLAGTKARIAIGLETPQPGLASSQPPTPWASGPPSLPVRTPATVSRQPARVEDSQPEASSPAESWVVDLGQGEAAAVDRVLIIGRNPQVDPGVEAGLVRVPANAAAVSETHLAIGVNETGPWVMDLGSDGGTSVTDEFGVFQRCVPHEMVALSQGQIVSYGGRRLELRRS